jgi:alpha-glucosidase
VGWDAATLRDVIARVEAALPDGAWPNWVLGNHDQPRIATRAGTERARIATMLLLTLRGAPTMYYGDELAMTDGRIPPDRVQDPWERRVEGLGRDPARTPMRWDASPNAGFTPEGVDPWLPFAGGDGIDVQTQRADPTSILHLTRDLLALRRRHRALAEGNYRAIDAPAGVFAYLRECDEERMMVALSVDGVAAHVPLPGPGRILRATHVDRVNERAVDAVRVDPFEGVVVILD